MSTPGALLAVVTDELFPDVDLALRRGRHIDRDDAEWYSFLRDAGDVLTEFYERYSCSLIHASDGYFYLLPTNDRLGRRHLAIPEMLVGQGLALLYLDPNTVRSGGVVERDAALSHLATVMGSDALVAAFNPKKKRMDERVAQQMVRQRFAEAGRKLAALGFLELLDEGRYRLRTSLMRFAEPVRGSDSPAQALAELVARGEVQLRPGGDKTESAAAGAASQADEGGATEPQGDPDSLDADVATADADAATEAAEDFAEEADGEEADGEEDFAEEADGEEDFAEEDFAEEADGEEADGEEADAEEDFAEEDFAEEADVEEDFAAGEDADAVAATEEADVEEDFAATEEADAVAEEAAVEDADAVAATEEADAAAEEADAAAEEADEVWQADFEEEDFEEEDFEEEDPAHAPAERKPGQG